jgi:16S rRNA (cytidine1402-2'-O)-methyltransferase
VVPLPGPSAFISAAVASGFPLKYIFFLGFVKKNTPKARKIFTNCKKVSKFFFPITFVFYVSPYRLKRSLELMLNVLGDIEVSLALEISKIHEEIKRLRLSEAIAECGKKRPQGEITVVFCLHKHDSCN